MTNVKKYELMNHQRKAIEFMLSVSRCAIFAATGTGKTLISLTYLKILDVGAVVIVPASIKHVWFDENVKFSVGLDMSSDIRSPAKVMVVSYDYIKNNSEILNDYNVVVLDEAHCIADYTTVRYQNLHKIIKNMQRVVLLSGYPVENHLQEIFVISLISDVLGKNYYHFLYKFFDVVRNNNGQIIKATPKHGSMDKIIELIKPISLVIPKDTVITSGIKKETVISRFDLSEEQCCIIRNLRDYGYYSDKRFTIECVNELVVFQKVMQLISGFVYDVNDLSEKYPFPLDSNPKLELLERIVKGKSDYLLWYLYDYELEMLRDYEKHCRLSKLQTDSRGKNLQHYKFSMYFTLPLSGGQFLQSQDRLYRIGRDTDVLSIVLLPSGEFGDRLAMMMDRKHKLTKKFIDSLFRCSI